VCSGTSWVQCKDKLRDINKKKHWSLSLFRRDKSLLFNLFRNSSSCLFSWLKPKENGRVTENSPTLTNNKMLCLEVFYLHPALLMAESLATLSWLAFQYILVT